jgi:hypothetical protein
VPDRRGAIEVFAAPAAQAPALPAPQKRKVLAILTDIRDATATTYAVDPRCDGVEDQTADLMFTGTSGHETVDGAYLDSSFGLEGVGGKAYPGSAVDVVRVLIDQASTYGSTCDAYAWAESADAAATAAGITLGNYQHRLYVLPPGTGCSWGGLGQVACGDSCRAWESTYSYYPCGTRGAHAHELGHNRGMLHASTDTNNDGNIDSEYGDYSDFMGGNVDELQHNNAPHKVQMGWIDAATVVDASAGGTFTISALELANPAFPQVLKLVPASGAPLYLSYRAGIGYDATIPNAGTYLGRTSVHRWAGGYENTVLLANIADGVTFGDANLQVAIRQVSHDGQGATVQVTHVTPPLLTVHPASIAEGQSGSKTLGFLTTVSEMPPWPITVHVQTYDGTATGGSDYGAGEWTYQIESSVTVIPVEIYGDTVSEGDETFELILTGVSGATYASSAITGTILDDEAVLSIGDASIAEGNAGTKLLTFTMTLSAPVENVVSFRASTANGTAAAGSDYVARSNVALSIPAGQVARTFNITLNGDTTIEKTETLFVNLDTVVGAQAGDLQGLGYVINDDGPLLTINDVSVGEGNSGTRVMTFTVSLSQVAPGPVSYTFLTATGGTATAGVDYVATTQSGQVIPQGQLSKTHSVVINADATLEPNESLLANVRNPVGASVWDGQGVGYILDDDGPVTASLRINDATISEGNSGTKLLTFTASLDAASAKAVTFNASTQGNTATAGVDFASLPSTGFTIPAGQLTRTFTVTILGDTAVENDEAFFVWLSSVTGATLADGQGIGAITNDDEAAAATLRVNDASISEGNSGTKLLTFTATLGAVSANAVTFNASTQGNTATAGVDFAALPLTAYSIPAGQLSKTFTVTINGDTAVEGDETFFVWLSSVTGATLVDGQGIGTIANDD